MTFNRKALSGTALVVLALLFVAVMLWSTSLLRGARVDLTQNHLYTLSDGTKKILNSIDEPINLYSVLLRQGDAGPAAAAHVLHARARDARGDGVALRRQAQARGDRSAAVLRRRGPRGELGLQSVPVGAAARRSSSASPAPTRPTARRRSRSSSRTRKRSSNTTSPS